jgi:hypothetical protein
MAGNQNGNGGDILLSFVVANASRRLNMAYRLPVEDLTAPKMISPLRQKKLAEHRSAVVRWCRENVLEPVPSAHGGWRRTRKIGVVATQKRREDQLRQMLPTMIQQRFDRRIVYLNDYDSVPEWLAEIPAVEAWLHPAGDLGASAKFVMADQWDGYYFTMDDDILYPPDYCEKMAKAIERYDRQAIICAHANILHPNLTRFNHRTVFRFRGALAQDTPVHLGGTGTLAFHAPSIGVGLGEFPVRNLDDPQLGAFCQRYHIPIVCVARPPNWMTPIKVDRGIYEDIMKDDTQLVSVIKSCEPWRINYPKNWPANFPATFAGRNTAS